MNRSSRRRALRLGGGSIVAATFGLLAGCSAPTDGSTATPEGERILALGDSYTIGTSVAPEERWVTKLAEKRRGAGYTVADPTIVAENGWTTTDLHEGIDDANLTDQYDLVTLLIGANNCFQEERPGVFRPKFAAMLERALGFAAGPESLLVISVPNYTLTPVGQQNQPQEHATRLNAYNSIIRDEASAAGTRYVDVVPPSENVTANPDLIAEDDLHPSGVQYDLWLERISPEAMAALER
ncbi:lipolytic protein G-D-S-L family [halophilic archaeon DL31]|jgi:lysophospholipase L1-like esterase|nr:lipolytic protein G-D-S-L family [halophilic archaeon DL31]